MHQLGAYCIIWQKAPYPAFRTIFLKIQNDRTAQRTTKEKKAFTSNFEDIVSTTNPKILKKVSEQKRVSSSDNDCLLTFSGPDA